MSPESELNPWGKIEAENCGATRLRGAVFFRAERCFDLVDHGKSPAHAGAAEMTVRTFMAARQLEQRKRDGMRGGVVGITIRRPML